MGFNSGFKGLITFLSPEIATSIDTHVLFSLSRIVWFIIIIIVITVTMFTICFTLCQLQNCCKHVQYPQAPHLKEQFCTLKANYIRRQTSHAQSLVHSITNTLY